MRATERRKKLLEVLCERRHDTAENLAYELGVTERTIRNDVIELSLSYPVYALSGRHDGGIHIAEGYYLGKQYLSPEQEKLLTSLAPTLDDDQRKVLESIICKFGQPSKK